MTEITLLDGSIGQELVKRAGKKPTPLWSTSVMLENPRLVKEVHDLYFKAGATVATTNTYSVLYDRLTIAQLEEKRHDLWRSAVQAALEARDAYGHGRVAGSIGPLIASYRPDICPPAQDAEHLYEEVVQALSLSCDVLLIETMSSVDQAEGAMRAAKKSERPVWLGVSVDDFDGAKLRSGEHLDNIAPVVRTHQPEAVLINCSRPEAVSQAVRIIAKHASTFGAYANGFSKISEQFLKRSPTVDALTARKDLSPKAYAAFAMDWIEQGATIVGGCCEVGPAHIQELAQQIRDAGHTLI